MTKLTVGHAGPLDPCPTPTIGDRLAAQQRERIAQSMLDGRAWAYSRAGLPVPEGDATDAPREETRTVMPDGWEDRRAKGRTHEQEGADTVTIPVKPSPGILMSMAIRSDHALGMPGFYDQPFNARDGITHAQRLAAALTEMRQVYEEVARRGFYRDEREGHYTAMVGGAPAVMSTQDITHAPEPPVIGRARALIEADRDRWVAIAKADLAALVALAVAL